MAYFIKNTPDLALFTLMEHDLERGFSLGTAFDGDTAGGRRTFFERDAFFKPLYFFVGHHAADFRRVSFFHAELWVREPERKLAIVGHEQKSRRVAVKAADGEKPFGDVFEKVCDAAF